MIVTVDDRPDSTLAVLKAIKQLNKRGVPLGDVAVAGPDGQINCLYGASPKPH